MADEEILNADGWLEKAKQTLAFLRLQPFDESTEEGRANERHRRVALTALASASAKAISVLTALVAAPLAFNYLGEDRFGLWRTISSVILMLTFADLGVGSGLLNLISAAHGKSDRASAQKSVSSAFFLLSGIAVFLAVIFFILYPHMDWPRLLNVSSTDAILEAGPAVFAFAVCFLINLPLGIIPRIQLGHQEGFINSVWAMGGNLLALGALLVAMTLHAGLPWLVLAMAGAPVLATLFNGAILFSRRRPWLAPRWSEARGEAIRSLFKLGAIFFVLQLSFAFSYTVDNLVISEIFKNQKLVAQYSLVAQMFSFAPMILEMFLSPLWPAYAEAVARGDVAWVKKTLHRSVLMSVGFAAVVSLALVFFGDEILRLWIRNEIHPPFLLLLGFGVWTVFSVAGNALAMFLNGSGAIKFQAACAVVLAVVGLMGKIVLAHRFGLAGIIWATVAAYFICVAMPMVFFIPRLLAQLQERSRGGTAPP